jgi:hypothetical protein
MGKGKAKLVIVFNHRYDQNLPVLREMYRSRFDSILFLVPGYDGSDPDVVPVHGHSHHFQDYMAQAYPYLRNDTGKYSHIVFAADDLILHPSLHASNVAGELQLDSSSGYIKSLVSFSELSSLWIHFRGALQTIHHHQMSLSVELPDRPEYIRFIERHGVPVGDLIWENVQPNLAGYEEYLAYKTMPYPLVLGYSDFIVVPSAVLQEFCRLCRVFTRAGLFVEVAVPMSLALSCPSIRQEKDISWKGIELWGDAEHFAGNYGYDLNTLLIAYPQKTIYIHPVKLSKWHGSPVIQ